MKYTIVAACLIGIALSGCGKQADKESTSATKSEAAASSSAAPAKMNSARQADLSVPLERYQKITDEQLVYLYHALSGLPLDYAKIADKVSVEYRSTTDAFKKKEILDALRPRIGAAILEAASGGRYVYFDFPNPVTVKHYDLSVKSFPLGGLPFTDGQYLMIGPSSYGMAFANGDAFKALPIADEAKAREIESLVSSGMQAGVVTYRDSYPTKARIYLYAHDIDQNNFVVNFQVTKLALTSVDGRPFAEK